MTESPRVYFVMREISRFGYEISVFNTQQGGIQNSQRNSSYVTGTVSWKNGCQIFFLFIVAENTGSVNI